MARVAVLFLALAFTLLSTKPAYTGVYNPSLIVHNVNSGCPIPNVNWSPEQFQVSQLVTVFAPLVPNITRGDCKQQASSLAVCAFDGSLAIQQGCCSSECAAQMGKLNELGCFAVILMLICNATADQADGFYKLLPVLTGAGERCSTYQAPPYVACPDGRIIIGGGPLAAEPPMPEVGAGLPGAGAGDPGTPSAKPLMPEPGATPAAKAVDAIGTAAAALQALVALAGAAAGGPAPAPPRRLIAPYGKRARP